MSARTAVVTGAARGIGAATADRLLEEGGTVVGVDVLPPAEPSPVVAKHPERFEHRIADVSDEAAVARAFDGLDRIDVLVNVAGTVLVKPFLDTTWADYRRTLDVNLGGTILACRYAVPLMRDGGVIVNVASISGHIGQTQHAVYAASKGAVLSMSRGLAWELAPLGIRVNTVSPGSVDTAMLREDIGIEARRLGQPFERVKAEREGEQALGRWARPEEVAHAIAFLASRQASFITGTDLLVDSGWVAK
ncbi:SDR family oxidoreductase [Streptomyces sp. NA02950]|uniref:SDR family NAD(P)-dependent oxidoreductase n=1 Tax=Streptomyces sp. NA02950 TaxID=2742137 RepID=UPI001590089F|nr:SDR family oxidoreductase [Streptomyces sp. NA02950]QKV96393.1 SDR family oxidoreductase [Streptomyces sp. NA02950]